MSTGLSSSCALENVGTAVVVFNGKQCAGNPGDTFPAQYVSDQKIGTGDLTETFKDTALAYYNAPTSGDPTNKSNLDTLAQQFATDWAAWRQTQFDEVLAGVAAIQPTGLADIEWDLGPDHCSTRFSSSPHNFHVQELGHADNQYDCTLTATPCIYYWGPPGQCVNGHLQLTRWKECLEDGRIIQRYVSTDTIT